MELVKAVNFTVKPLNGKEIVCQVRNILADTFEECMYEAMGATAIFMYKANHKITGYTMLKDYMPCDYYIDMFNQHLGWSDDFGTVTSFANRSHYVE